jgi:acyl carrier protein
MNDSSPSPEGILSHCPVCGTEVKREFGKPLEDARCTQCGHSLKRSAEMFASIRQLLSESLNVPPDSITVHTRMDSLGADSLELIELVMDLEEEFGIPVSKKEADQFKSVGDILRFFAEERADGAN